jgi:chromate reductase
MANSKNVAVLVGSLRKESHNRKMALALAKIAPPSLKLDIVEIGDLSFYNQDLETDTPPAPWVEFRKRIAASDAVLFVTPEYNRGVPGVLKNAIDVGSRPYGKAVWSRKPAAVVTVSPGVLGGYGANHQLRASFVFLDMPVLQAPEAYIGGADKLFGPDLSFANPSTQDLMSRFLGAFDQLIGRHGAPAPAS